MSSDSFSDAEGMSSSTEVPSSAGCVDTDKLFPAYPLPLTTVMVESFCEATEVGTDALEATLTGGGAGTYGGGEGDLSAEVAEGFGGKLGVEVLVGGSMPLAEILPKESLATLLVMTGATLLMGLLTS